MHYQRNDNYVAETQEFFQVDQLRSNDQTPDLYVNRGTQTLVIQKSKSTQTDNTFNYNTRHQYFAAMMADDFFGEDERLKTYFKQAFSQITEKTASEVKKRYGENNE